jgi:hypothetical protein
MLATGWTADTLARQPAPVVRAMCHRLFAERVWNPEAMAAARSPAPDRKAFASLTAWAAARAAKRTAIEYAELVETVLWPEDDDG